MIQMGLNISLLENAPEFGRMVSSDCVNVEIYIANYTQTFNCSVDIC